MDQEPNDLLRAAREVADLTQGQLAEMANAQVETATGVPGAMDGDYVGKLERGIHRWPNKHYRQGLRLVLQAATDADLGFFSTRQRSSTVVRSPELLRGGDEVERKAFLRVLAGSVAGLSLSDPLGEFVAQAADSTPHRRIGMAEVDQIRHLAHLFAKQDHLYGGGLSARAVMAQLSAAAELTEGQFAQAAVRQAFFSSLAELADVAGGICFDAGLHRQAERAFRFSVGCATEADDWSLRTKALSGLANLAVHQQWAEDALSFAEMALVRADRLTPLVSAMMHTRHARALGANGSARAADCRRAVGRAEESFATARSGDEPAWITYYDQAHLERDAGRALLLVALQGDDYQAAYGRLDASIAGFSNGYSRGKALAKANLATLTMARVDPHHAVSLGHEAVESVGAVRSDRVQDAFRQLRLASKGYRSMPDVRELNQRVDQVLRATTV